MARSVRPWSGRIPVPGVVSERAAERRSLTSGPRPGIAWRWEICE